MTTDAKVEVSVERLSELVAVYDAAKSFVNVHFNPATKLLYSEDKAVLLSYRVRECERHEQA